MSLDPVKPELSAHLQVVLNRVIPMLDTDGNCNIYEFVQSAISDNHILASQNALVMESCFALKEYLLAHEFVTEQAEMTGYMLTYKGRMLKDCGSLEQFHKKHMQKESLLAQILKLGTKAQQVYSASKTTNN